MHETAEKTAYQKGRCTVTKRDTGKKGLKGCGRPGAQDNGRGEVHGGPPWEGLRKAGDRACPCVNLVIVKQ